MHVCAITGKKGSGKGTAARYIQKKYDARLFSFSKILDDILQRMYVPNGRDNEIKLALALRKLFGNNILARILKKDIQEFKPTFAVIDGMRYEEEHTILKDLPNFKLLAITAEPEQRYERIRKRMEKADDQTLSWKAFQNQEQQETELQLDKLLAKADSVIGNDNDIQSLYNAVDDILKSWSFKIPAL